MCICVCKPEDGLFQSALVFWVECLMEPTYLVRLTDQSTPVIFLPLIPSMESTDTYYYTPLFTRVLGIWAHAFRYTFSNLQAPDFKWRSFGGSRIFSSPCRRNPFSSSSGIFCTCLPRLVILQMVSCSHPQEAGSRSTGLGQERNTLLRKQAGGLFLQPVAIVE